MPSSTICIDANFVVRLVLSGTYESPVVSLWQQWHEKGDDIVAPTLLHYEVSHALRRYVVHGELLPDEALEGLETALSLGITLYGDRGLHKRALRLAERLLLPAAYDAHYLALAETLGAEFWTADHRLVNAVGAALSWVHKIEL
jgi:predicted nucleic acid-binding protein